ncbi:hypothetical protein [Jiella marina]|uniref:hypothetical protein n=1 Tax=Jiella sp. LLJ827 TaxID=2917712 RepID=UPI0021018C8E|nr:hypothetical protein [Jiella sp. LLJ827]MCQ0990367.1 hypothetical protein [Jiella sp. LLJ827]
MSKTLKAAVIAIAAAPLLLTSIANEVAAAPKKSGTIKSGSYETVCDKKPKSCGSEVELPPRKPKAAKPAKKVSRKPGGNGYTPIPGKVKR